MIRCNGREALSILAEVEAEKRTLTDAEDAYVRKQANSFVNWLMTQNNISKDDAKDRALGIIAAEVKLLTASDPYADLVWSRGEEVGQMEINLAEGEQDFEVLSDAEHKSYESYWNRMESIAERNVGKYPDEVWRNSQSRMEACLELLNKIKEEQFGKLLDGKGKSRLFKINTRLNELRFGITSKKGKVSMTKGGGVLMHRHWAICKNLVNELLGNPKRYVVKEFTEKTEEEKVDAMDYANYGTLDKYEIYK